MVNFWLNNLPLWGLLIGFAALLFLAMEFGYRAGSWRHVSSPGEKEEPVGAMVAAMLALLALVLGFTFSMAALRFDQRREAVLNESNAIGTTFLRAQLLAEPEKSEISKLLKEYVDIRIPAAQQGKLQEAIVRSENVQESLWKQAIAVAQKDPASVISALFINSLNEVIDLHAKRIHIGIRSHIPHIIWLVLIGFTVLGLGAVGYQAGLSTTKRSPAMIGMCLAFAAIFALIGDLDRSQEGYLRVGQEAMIDLQRSMASANFSNAVAIAQKTK